MQVINFYDSKKLPDENEQLQKEPLQLYADIIENVKNEYLSEKQDFPWIIGFSGGKDSTLVAHIVFEALFEVPPTYRTRKVYFVSNDTLVESPLVVNHMKKVLEQIEVAGQSFSLPISTKITTPKDNQTFWTLLIGKGYPSPNRSMRWCTDRLKIQPTSTFILDKVSEFGKAIVVLGVRKSESNTRKQSIEKHQNLKDSNLTPHGSLPGALIYRPIVDLTTDDVWEILASKNPAWGGSHNELIQLYRDAAGGECPIVLSEEEAPGCGTNSSRFGCWTCTVVDKDKSLQGFVDIGKTEFQHLLDFRDWLKSIRDLDEYRQLKRRNGTITFKLDKNGDNKHIKGPFTLNARKMILEKLLAVQSEYGEELISENEVNIIYKIWQEDILNLMVKSNG